MQTMKGNIDYFYYIKRPFSPKKNIYTIKNSSHILRYLKYIMNS